MVVILALHFSTLANIDETYGDALTVTEHNSFHTGRFLSSEVHAEDSWPTASPESISVFSSRSTENDGCLKNLTNVFCDWNYSRFLSEEKADALEVWFQ